MADVIGHATSEPNSSAWTKIARSASVSTGMTDQPCAGTPSSGCLPPSGAAFFGLEIGSRMSLR